MHIYYLSRILGKRPFAVFLAVTFLIVAILAAINVASRHALKQYVEDQLERLEWDIAAYQSGEVRALPAVADALQGTDGIEDYNQLLFLRNSMTTEDVAYIDGQPVRLPWLSLLTTGDSSILPLGLRPQDGKAVLVLVGTKAQMGDAYTALQGKTRFEMKLDDHHAEPPATGPNHATVFRLELERTIRIERNDLNRWFLEQTGSPSLIPEIGAILVTSYDPEIVGSFDSLARGIVSHHEDGDVHEESGSYFPDLVHLLRVDTERLVSGWDMEGSLRELEALQGRLESNAFPAGPRTFIDSAITVLLERMHGTAKRVGLISLLIALPLLWVGWILMGNLSSILLLNERRKFGLMRLRGASGAAMGRALKLSIGTGALVGGMFGALVGTLLPVWIYEGGMLPLDTLLKVQQPSMLLAFIVFGVFFTLAVNRKLVRYAATISPIEASRRVVQSEHTEGKVTFGWTGFLALLLGSYKIVGWSIGYSMADSNDPQWLSLTDRALDFVGFPLFLYGIVTFLASRRRLLNVVLGSLVAAIAGRLSNAAVRHISTRPQRAAGFILIVAMMTTIGLYPTVMTAVFDNKIERAAGIQVGSDIQLTVNASDIVSNTLLAEGGVGSQYRALRESVPDILESLRRIEGVRSATWTLFEGVSDGVYMPGYGFNGLPLYFLPDPQGYLDSIHHEASLGQQARFADLVAGLEEGRVLLSPAVSDFMEKSAGEPIPLGRRTTRDEMVSASVGGAVWYLPASPLVSVTDRDSFDAARIDYVNYLFMNNAYMVAAPEVSSLEDLDVLITGVQFAITLAPGTDAAAVRAEILASLPVEPSHIRLHDDEVRRIGSDMYVYLARHNVQIYLVGGLVLAVIGILAVAYVNYVSDRRTLALLRIRGAGPWDTLRFFSSGIIAPSLLGLALGIAVSLAAGYGITNLVWQLRDVKNILLYLATHMAISAQTIAIAVALLLITSAVGIVFSQWAFRKTVRQGLSDH